MKILIIGGNGQLGSDLNIVLTQMSHDCVCIGSKDLDIAKTGFEDYFIDKAFDIIINTSAYHNLEECEKNKDKSFNINTLPLYKLSEVSNINKSLLIHFSTDYVFDGFSNKPYTELDSPNPLNVYGKTKLMGESIIQIMCERFYIVRTSGLYGKHPCRGKGKNFVDLMLHLAESNKELKVVDDEELSPTNTFLLSKQISKMIDKKVPYGLYHAVSQDSCTWYDFAKEIFKIRNKNVTVLRAGPDDFPKKTPRPSFSSLLNANLNDVNCNFMTTWQEGLKEYLI